MRYYFLQRKKKQAPLDDIQGKGHSCYIADKNVRFILQFFESQSSSSY